MFLAIYLEFATFSERNFGGIAVGKAASEVTTNFCRRQGGVRNYYKFFKYIPPGRARTYPSISNIVNSDATSS